MIGKIFLLIGAGLFAYASYKNLQVKKELIVPSSFDNKMKTGLVLLPLVFLYITYAINLSLYGLIFTLSLTLLFYSLNAGTGFTKDQYIYFSGYNIFLSRKKLEDLWFVDIKAKYKNDLIIVALRGKLFKKSSYYEFRYGSNIERICKNLDLDFYPLGVQGPKDKIF
ncbi:MAG: hypothetical protein Q4E36_00310 [Bacillota bacterium]|nr:hypothetical protein [Bacillota bacterium]